MDTATLDLAFLNDVRSGLTATPKSLPSKYLYDHKGDVIFQQIMAMPEYYPTDCELETFQRHQHAFMGAFSSAGPFRLVEFGAGDGMKTKVLLRHFLAQQADFTYSPIDISAHAVAGLTESLAEELPDLAVEGIVNDYFAALQSLSQQSNMRNVVLFLGSNIGNFSVQGAKEFLRALSATLNPGDLLLLGSANWS